MRIDLIGFGMDSPRTLTLAARRALGQAQLVLGAPRLLTLAKHLCSGPFLDAISPGEIQKILQKMNPERAAVLYSGDLGFYSGAEGLRRALPEAELVSYPGISSVQYFAAKLGMPWQDWRFVSAHGADADPAPQLMLAPRCFFLTDPKHTPAALCAALTRDGLGDCACFVGEYLGAPEEKITWGPARELAQKTFSPLCVLLVCRGDFSFRPAPGLPDQAFLRQPGIPLTKQMVRAAILAKLSPRPGQIAWDLGCGSGGVSTELALALAPGRVFALDRDPEACRLTLQNAHRLGAYNLTAAPGLLPDALAGLPRPDLVFLGGGTAFAPQALRAALALNPNVRFALTAVSLEGLSAGLAALEGAGLEADLTQLSVSRAEKKGSHRLLMAQNPVFLLTGVRP